MNAPANPLSFQSSSGSGISSRARIGHVNLRVTNIDRATDFYRDVLGFTVTCYGPSTGLPIVFLALSDYHHHVALNWFYDSSSNASSIRPGGLNHLAIVYPDELSLAQAVERVLLHGELIEDARDHGSTLSVYLRDPDGNGIELYCDRPRSQWFDAMGELVLRSEPIHIDKWLMETLARASQVCVSSSDLHELWRFHDGKGDAVSADVC